MARDCQPGKPWRLPRQALSFVTTGPIGTWSKEILSGLYSGFLTTKFGKSSTRLSGLEKLNKLYACAPKRNGTRPHLKGHGRPQCVSQNETVDKLQSFRARQRLKTSSFRFMLRFHRVLQHTSDHREPLLKACRSTTKQTRASHLNPPQADHPTKLAETPRGCGWVAMVGRPGPKSAHQSQLISHPRGIWQVQGQSRMREQVP